MKYIPRHTKSIEIEFSNNKTKSVCFRITIPIGKQNRDISKWYQTTKKGIALAEGIPIYNIKGSHKIIESTHFDRILFEWAGGISLDMPDDATDYDYQIVLKQLEVLKMSTQKTNE